MSTVNFDEMAKALRQAVARYPNCRIANCDCDSKGTEWKAGCYCMCHFTQMDIKFGKDKWNMNDFDKQSKQGLG